MFHKLKHTAYYIVGSMLAVPMLAVSTLFIGLGFIQMLITQKLQSKESKS